MPIVSNSVNDVAITTLDSSPLDPATGLPVPTIAVATAGGISTITSAGTVVNSTATTAVVSVDIDGKILKAIRSDGVVAIYDNVGAIGVAPSTTLSASTTPALLGTVTKGSVRSKGSSLGLTLIKRNPSNNAASMVARITNVIPPMWQVGDIRGAYLADTVAETVTGSGELVTNGTFATDTSGWTLTTTDGGTSVSSGGALVLTNGGSGTAFTRVTQAVNTVVGRAYTASAEFTKGTALQGALYAGTTSGNNNLGNINGTATGLLAITFVATGVVTYLTVSNNTNATGVTSTFDNISVKLAEPDRSVKNQSLIVNGTLTKTAVASGSNLVCYGGFAA